MKKIIALFLITFNVFAAAPQGTTGGVPPSTMIGPLNATKLELVDISGQYHIGSILALNTSAAAAFLQFFDQPCSGVTVGTTRPSWVVPVSANNYSFTAYNGPLDFFTPICVVSTTTPAGAVGSAASVYMQIFTP